MRKYFFVYIIITLSLALGCGRSYEEQQRISREERARLAREDSAALKIGVTPSLDCLPLYVAKEEMFFDTAKADIRLKYYSSQLDSEAALRKGRVEGTVTDLVRCAFMKDDGIPLRYVTSTNLQWQLIGNRKSRIKTAKQMADKMVAMTRHSALDMLLEIIADSAKLNKDFVLCIQVNDPNIRLQMLQNNELDALFFAEPQATTARLFKNAVIAESSKMDFQMGVVAFRGNILDGNRQKQIEVFIEGYNRAVEEINKNGVKHYAELIMKNMKADAKTIAALPDIKYKKVEAPRQKDIERAEAYCQKKRSDDSRI